MFALTREHRFFLYAEQVDMRKGINGLYKLIKNQSAQTLQSGDIFVFCSRNRSNIKLLKWDGDGFMLYHKRLEAGTFEMPEFNPALGSQTLSWKTFSLMMEGISFKSVSYRKRYTR